MPTRTITLTEALSEIKQLNARITKAISMFTPLAVTTEENKTPGGYNDLPAFEAAVKSDYQSLNDLIERRRKLKAQLIKANSTTKVKFKHPATGVETEYSIAEIIDLKDNVRDVEASILNMLQRSLREAEQITMRSEMELNTQTQGHVSARMGSSTAKISQEALDGIRESLRKSIVGIIRDPLNIRSEIKKRDEAMQAFLDTIDVQLSIANATTTIEIDC